MSVEFVPILFYGSNLFYGFFLFLFLFFFCHEACRMLSP